MLDREGGESPGPEDEVDGGLSLDEVGPSWYKQSLEFKVKTRPQSAGVLTDQALAMHYALFNVNFWHCKMQFEDVKYFCFVLLLIL